jgi:hypothetical protein
MAMNRIRTFACTALLASLAACQGNTPPSTASKPQGSSPEPESALGRVVHKEIRKAREKLATENISLKSGVRFNGNGGVNIDTNDSNDDRPEAEITPKGDLLIEGKAIAINNEQRELLLGHRAQLIGIAESGMDIGVQGADLAAKAMGEAFKGILSGKSEQEIEKSVEAEAAGIKQSAAKLCARLPGLLASQQELAATLPEFKPYATMTKEDIDDCMKETKDNTVQQAEVQSEIRGEIRDAIRGSVRGAVRQDEKEVAADAAAEANAEATTRH